VRVLITGATGFIGPHLIRRLKGDWVLGWRPKVELRERVSLTEEEFKRVMEELG